VLQLDDKRQKKQGKRNIHNGAKVIYSFNLFTFFLALDYLIFLNKNKIFFNPFLKVL